MERIRLGIIGCGGRSKAHRKSFAALDYVEVVAVADLIEERRAEAAQQFGCARIYADHNEFFDNESKETVDAILICVEPTAHNGIEMRAIEAEIPFLVEKPIHMDLGEAEKIAKLIEEKNLITAVGFQDRYLDLMEIIKAELPKHKAGGLVYGSWVGGVPARWWWLKKSTCGR